MRYELGPAFSFTRPVPGAAPTSPSGKSDPQITHKGDDGLVATFTVPKYDVKTSNRLIEVRLYFVPRSSSAIPAGAPAYIASAYPFGHADVSGLQSGGDVPITIPSVGPDLYHAQYVLGYDV